MTGRPSLNDHERDATDRSSDGVQLLKFSNLFLNKISTNNFIKKFGFAQILLVTRSKWISEDSK